MGDTWGTLDDEARRAYLLAAGVRLHVLASPALRPQGTEVRYITGDLARVVGTLHSITEAEAAVAAG